MNFRKKKLPQFIYLYRKECFTSEYFGGCLAVLQITDKKDKILEDLSIIHRQMESPKEN